MSIIPLLDANHLSIPRIQIDNIRKDLLSFALLKNNQTFLLPYSSASFRPLLWRLGLDIVFGDFLENKNSSEQKNYTTFTDLP